MADTPAPARPSSGGGTGARLGRKVGPLPVWAWAVIALVVGYFLYKHFSGGTGAATGTTPAGVSGETPIPLGDQSGAGTGTTSGSRGTQTAVAGIVGGTSGDTRTSIPLGSQTGEGTTTALSNPGTTIPLGSLSGSGTTNPLSNTGTTIPLGSQTGSGTTNPFRVSGL